MENIAIIIAILTKMSLRDLRSCNILKGSARSHTPPSPVQHVTSVISRQRLEEVVASRCEVREILLKCAESVQFAMANNKKLRKLRRQRAAASRQGSNTASEEIPEL